MRGRRGLSLLEVMVSLSLLALILWSAQSILIGMLRGTKQADVHQEALIVMDAVADRAAAQARIYWTDPQTYAGSFEQYSYQVTELAPLPNPRRATEVLPIRRLRVEVDFATPDRQAKHYETQVSVAR